MKVKIVNCSSPEYWYANSVGISFDVVQHRDGNFSTLANVTNDKTPGTIDRIDCVILSDKVNHPSHYGNGDNDPYEVIKIIEHFGLSFSEGNVLKYLLRYKKKNGMEDLEKCRWYVNRVIEQSSPKKDAV